MGVPFFENATLDELKTAKRCAPTQEGFVRFHAIELLSLGYGREEVAKIVGRSLRSIHRWVVAFQERGIDGVAIKGRSGRPRIIPRDKFTSEIVPLVLAPPADNEPCWTGVKLHGYLVSDLRVELSYRTTLNYMHESGLSRVTPRRWPENQDQEKRAEFIEKIEVLKQDPKVELWYADETGIEGDPRPRKVWVKKGDRPKAPYLGDHLRVNIVGAVTPQRGDFFSLVVPHTDTEVFQIFVNELAKHTTKSKKKIVLVLDNASWHHTASINWHHIKPMFLPPYSPDLNPIEVLWLYLKQHYFANWFAKTPEQLTERACSAVRNMIQNPKNISSITSF